MEIAVIIMNSFDIHVSVTRAWVAVPLSLGAH